MRGQLGLTDVDRGHNYSVCARLKAAGGWGQWRRTWYRMGERIVAVVINRGGYNKNPLTQISSARFYSYLLQLRVS